MTDTPTRADLLPCPFCGGSPLIGQTLDDAWYAMCIVDHCSKLDAYWRTEAEAIAAWNTRAPTADAERIAALEDENAALKAIQADDGELLTIAWMDGSHSSNTAHRARIAELEAEVERLRRNVRGWVEWHRRCDADDDCTYLNDNAWCDAEALASTGMGLLARAALKDTRND